MKVRQWKENFDKLIEIWPEALDWDVVYSHDDEGNGFELVFFAPNVGHYNGYDFTPFNEGSSENNALCLN